MAKVSAPRSARYEFLRPLGRGGMGDVWLAHDTRLDREVALKSLGPAGLADSTLEHEARVLARLRHPGIVTVFDLATIDRRQYLVMEAVPGTPLADVITERGPLPERLVRHIGAQVSEALAYAHEQGVLHNDVKPANILLDEDERARLIDFGISARPLQTIAPTEAVGLVGTLPYLAPELIQGARPTPATDIYALGVTLFEALSGRTPWSGDRLADRMTAEPPSVRLFAPEVSPSIEGVLRRALKPAPGERLRSAAELAAALDPKDTRPIAVTAAPAPRARPSRFGWRTPLLVALGTVLLGGSAFAVANRGDDGAAPSATPGPSAPAGVAATQATPATRPPATATPAPTSTPTTRPAPTPTKQPVFFPGNPGKKKGHDK